MPNPNVRIHDQPCWTVVLCFPKQQGPLLDSVWQTCLPKQRQAKGLKWIRCQASERISSRRQRSCVSCISWLLFLGFGQQPGSVILAC